MRFCSALSFGLLASVAIGDPAARAEEVLIGAQLPLSGPLAAFAGPRLRAGVEVAVEEINSSQMLGPGRTIKLSIEDDAGDKTQTIALINKRATVDHVTAILGPTNSALALPAAPVANELKVPMLAIACVRRDRRVRTLVVHVAGPGEQECRLVRQARGLASSASNRWR